MKFKGKQSRESVFGLHEGLRCFQVKNYFEFELYFKKGSWFDF